MPFITFLRKKIGINVCEAPRAGPNSCQSENNSIEEDYV